MCDHLERFGLTDFHLRQRRRLASDFLRNGLFKKLNAVCRHAVLPARGSRGGSDDGFARPSIGEPCLDPHGRTAPAGRDESKVMSRNHEEFIGQLYRLIAYPRLARSISISNNMLCISSALLWGRFRNG
jgi:hypothetical protein